jgi:hypothetical protein
MEHLPGWATAFNTGRQLAEAANEAGVSADGKFSATAELSPVANHFELDFCPGSGNRRKARSGANNRYADSSLSAHDLVGKELGHSYVDHGRWFVMLVLAGYQMPDMHNTGTTHFSP